MKHCVTLAGSLTRGDATCEQLQQGETGLLGESPCTEWILLVSAHLQNDVQMHADKEHAFKSLDKSYELRERKLKAQDRNGLPARE